MTLLYMERITDQNKLLTLKNILSAIRSDFPESVTFERFHEKGDDYDRAYNVYRVITNAGNPDDSNDRLSCDGANGGAPDICPGTECRTASLPRTVILKQTDEKEIAVYENLLSGKGLPAPELFGWSTYPAGSSERWFLMEDIPGDDLREFTKELAIQSADSLTKIFNRYWQEDHFEEQKLDDRFERYWARINKRAKCLNAAEAVTAITTPDTVTAPTTTALPTDIAAPDTNPDTADTATSANATLRTDAASDASGIPFDKLSAAYQIFLDRQLTCPRTLCNGDFLQQNAIHNDRGVILIDWGFSGIMPYSLDIARLITHGSEAHFPFEFYMDDDLRKLFVRQVYEKLAHKPDYDRYVQDITLACLNECIEFIEEELKDESPERDEVFDYYLEKAIELADRILSW